MQSTPHILQLCYSYDSPFLYLSNQYAAALKSTPCTITTVYVRGAPEAQIIEQSKSDEVIFLNLNRCQKRKAITYLQKLHQQRNFLFCISHQHQALYIAKFIPQLTIMGVFHGQTDYRYKRIPYPRFWLSHLTKTHKNHLALLAVSDALRDELRKNLPHLPTNQIQTLHNSVNPEEMRNQLLTREEARNALQLGDYFWFVNVGRLVRDKDQETLIRGFAQISAELPNVRLAIIGSGKLANFLKKVAAQENITDKIIFFGNIPDTYRYLTGFDSLVVSSVQETFGMVLLEAMVTGLPIIASDLTSLTEVVGDTALRFPSGQKNQLAACLKTIYQQDKASQEQIKKLMYQQVLQYYSTEIMSKQFWSLPFVKNAWGAKNIGKNV